MVEGTLRLAHPLHLERIIWCHARQALHNEIQDTPLLFHLTKPGANPCPSESADVPPHSQTYVSMTGDCTRASQSAERYLKQWFE